MAAPVVAPASVLETSSGIIETRSTLEQAAQITTLTRLPRRSKDGVAYFEINPYTADGRSLTGAIVWEGAEVLAKYLVWRQSVDQQFANGKSALELGAGTGIVGLTLSMLGASVVLSDRDPALLELQRRCISANPSIAERLSVVQLDFTEPATYLGDKKLDLIVASEVLYDGCGVDLARAIAAHVQPEAKTEVIMAYVHRDEAPLDAFLASLFEHGFSLHLLEQDRSSAGNFESSSLNHLLSWEQAASAIRAAHISNSPVNVTTDLSDLTQILHFTKP